MLMVFIGRDWHGQAVGRFPSAESLQNARNEGYVKGDSAPLKRQFMAISGWIPSLQAKSTLRTPYFSIYGAGTRACMPSLVLRRRPLICSLSFRLAYMYPAPRTRYAQSYHRIAQWTETHRRLISYTTTRNSSLLRLQLICRHQKTPLRGRHHQAHGQAIRLSKYGVAYHHSFISTISRAHTPGPNSKAPNPSQLELVQGPFDNASSFFPRRTWVGLDPSQIRAFPHCLKSEPWARHVPSSTDQTGHTRPPDRLRERLAPS